MPVYYVPVFIVPLQPFGYEDIAIYTRSAAVAEIYAPQVSGYAEFWADLWVTRPARGEVLVAWCCHEVGMLAIIYLV